MHNRLVHAYVSINPDSVWQTVQEDSPRLVALLEPLVPPEPLPRAHCFMESASPSTLAARAVPGRALADAALAERCPAAVAVLARAPVDP